MLKLYVGAKTQLDNARAFLAELNEDQSGAGILEYTLVVGLMAVFIAAAFATLQGNITTALTNIGTKLGNIK